MSLTDLNDTLRRSIGDSLAIVVVTAVAVNIIKVAITKMLYLFKMIRRVKIDQGEIKFHRDNIHKNVKIKIIDEKIRDENKGKKSKKKKKKQKNKG